ncbi:MAG: betaine/proline/choline family ABC transporter ATP-binding protein [Chromatiales bacterium]|jgi:glycine betaine/proline transport system ATP-binding protein|nr:betaine/proline/choline family ABC transporter ATP-binding protein [Chromatiales bacterium]
MSEANAAISCRDLWKVYGEFTDNLQTNDQEQVPAVAARLRATECVVAAAGINLDIAAGEFFVLMGLSGSGKSTLLRCLSRLTEPSAGSVKIEGQDLLRLSDRELMDVRRHKMGMVFQHFGLFPHMTVLENVAFPLRVQGIGNDERETKARAMIELVGLQGREEAMTSELSGGQKQRVGIARSLAVDPAIWFLDEPFSALDPLIRSQMQSELLQLQQRLHKTIVFVTHDFAEAVRLADRIAIMKDGMVEQVGRPADIVLNPASDYVAKFVAEAPRGRILKVAHVMRPAAPGEEVSRSLPQDTDLEGALTYAVDGLGDIGVTDDAGDLVGVVAPSAIAKALSIHSTAEPMLDSAQTLESAQEGHAQ